MSSLLSYRTLFSVDILHEYYLSMEEALYDNNAAVQTAMLENQRRVYDIR